MWKFTSLLLSRCGLLRRAGRTRKRSECRGGLGLPARSSRARALRCALGSEAAVDLRGVHLLLDELLLGLRREGDCLLAGELRLAGLARLGGVGSKGQISR